jgi:3-hydroxyacyl-CoA dehydrogenase
MLHNIVELFVSANIKSRVKKGNMTQEGFEKALSLLRGALDYEQFRDADIVIEASQGRRCLVYYSL